MSDVLGTDRDGSEEDEAAEAPPSPADSAAGNGQVDRGEVIVAGASTDVGARLRQAGIYGGLGVALLVFTQFILNPPGPARGTPMAVVFQGVVGGLLASLTATGLILMYRSIRILNFASAALGLPCLLFALGMVTYLPDFPFVLTLLGAIALGAILGALIDLAFGRRFAKAPRLVMTVVSIVGAGLIVNYSRFIFDAPWFPEQDEVDQATDFAPERIARLLPFPGFKFQVGDFPIEFRFAHLFAIQMSILALILVGLLIRYTRLGTAVRAAAENSERASLLGISTYSLGTMVWAIVGGLTAVAAVVGAFAGDPLGIPGDAVAAGLLAPIAAAVLARFNSIPVAVAASVGIGILATSLRFTTRENADVWVTFALFAVVVLGLVLQRKSLFRLETQAASSWQATDEPRPIPKELRQVGGIQAARIVGVVLVLAVALAFPFLVPVRHQLLGADIFIYSIAVLSLVVLTGWGGQVSLGQYAFVGIGALLTGHLATEGPGFWFAIPVATVLTGAFALLLGVPALRIRGLFLAGGTFAFAVFIQAFMVNPNWGRKLLETNLTRPKLVFLDFDDERSMYFLCLVGLVLTVVVITNLRRSRFGRLLIALRDNETNVQSFGVRAVRMKLYAFAVAGGIAGFAGALLEVRTRGADGLLFGADVSLQLFVVAIIGGIAAPAGALLGAAYQNILQYFFPSNRIVDFLAPLVPLLLIYARPGGFLSILQNLRDAILRIVAQRRQIVVPSLFADYDAEALERRLIPIGEPSMTDGLALMPHDQRYTIDSELYGLPTRPQAELEESRESAELLAITAASDVEPPPTPEPEPEAEAELAGVSAGGDER